jgi:hypothetical protein
LQHVPADACLRGLQLRGGYGTLPDRLRVLRIRWDVFLRARHDVSSSNHDGAMMRAACTLVLGTLFCAVRAQAQAPAAVSTDPATPAGSTIAAPPPIQEDVSAPVPEAPVDLAVTSAGAEGALSEAELQELGFSANAPAVDTNIKVSGFMDFGTMIALERNTRAITGNQAFGIGNLNVYVSKNLSESIRTMAEVRFSYLPHGAPESVSNPVRTNTYTADYADFGRATMHWGGIEIERAYLEWAAHRYLTVRAGSFLTPYGIWNVDHGSPIIITVNRPYVIGLNYFPERQTGFELYGRADAGNDSIIGYHLTVSNGTGPFTEYAELDRNKAVGGRVYWEYHKLGELRIGGSAYYGRDTSATDSTSFVDGAPVTAHKITSQSDQLGLAADLVWRYAGIHVQAEVITRQTKYTEAGRAPRFSLGDLRTHYPTDNTSWGGYLLLGYRFDWGGIMPYVLVQRVNDTADLLISGATPLMAGLNIRPIDALALKVEYMHVTFDDEVVYPRHDINMISAQAAWAF